MLTGEGGMPGSATTLTATASAPQSSATGAISPASAR
jgi:hypothetical protein